jgi:hypothetical protein
MKLSFGTLTLRFREGYHRLNRLAKHGRPHLWFDAADAPREARPNSQDFVPYLGPAALFPSPQ